MRNEGEQPEEAVEQPFIEHLIELRSRLIRMLIAVVVVVLCLFPFANNIYSFVAGPLLQSLPTGQHMIATQVASPLVIPLKLTFMVAVIVAMPYLLYQMWAFVAPGLYRHERRLALPLLVSSIVLFYAGMAFAYFIVFPLVFSFMTSTTPDGVQMMTDISAYLDFVTLLFFAFGVAFEVPIATILIILVGIVSVDTLASKRPYIIVGAFIIGMLLTPPDVLSQTLLAVPMWLLFESGLLFARVVMRRRAAEEKMAEDAAQEVDDAPTQPISATQLKRPQPPYDESPEQSVEPDPDMPGPTSPASAAQPSEPQTTTRPVQTTFSKTFDVDSANAPLTRMQREIQFANELRERGEFQAARRILHRVVEKGNDSDRRTAENILNQIAEFDDHENFE